MSNPYDNASEKMSILGPTLVFKGELSAEEDLMLKGRVEGSINHTASLRIGEEGSVAGDVRAKYITVDGEVEGDLHGSASVTVKGSATVEGNIYAPVVSLVEGARFKGSIDMDAAKKAADSPQPKEAAKSKKAEASDAAAKPEDAKGAKADPETDNEPAKVAAGGSK